MPLTPDPYEAKTPDPAATEIEGNETETTIKGNDDQMTTITHPLYSIFTVLALWGYNPDDTATFEGVPIENQPSFTFAFQTSFSAKAMHQAGHTQAEIEQWICNELEAGPSLRRGSLVLTGDA